MIQKMVIQVESSKPLNEVGEDRVLLYDKSKQVYFAVSRDSLLAAQNAEIQKVKNELRLVKEKNEKFKEQIIELFGELKAENEQKRKDFLSLYQETNSKLINMVKSLMEE